MRNFKQAVVKEDGTFAEVPYTSYEEASKLATQYESAKNFFLAYEPDEDDEPDDIDSDEGFDPYTGYFTYDC